MRIGVPKEEQAGETLVSATPKTAAKLISLGYDVIVEAGAGAAAKFPDEEYVTAGAAIGASADVWAVGHRHQGARADDHRGGAASRRRGAHRSDVAGRAA